MQTRPAPGLFPAICPRRAEANRMPFDRFLIFEALARMFPTATAAIKGERLIFTTDSTDITDILLLPIPSVPSVKSVVIFSEEKL